MRKLSAWLLLCILLSATPAMAADPELKTEEQKTLYALGIAIGTNLAGFTLNAADLEAVKAGITDAVLNHEKKADLQVYGPKITELQQARAKALAAVERKAGQVYSDKASGQKDTTRTGSGLVISTLKEGTGPSPKATDTVKVHYHGTLTDGTVFDSSVQRGEPAVIPLNGVITCWTEALQRMKVGGKSRLVCPADLAYGDNGRMPRIKPGATLVFEVELLDIVTK